MFELRLLGPIELATGAEIRKLGGPRQRALCAFLALHQGRVVPVDEIVDAVWAADAPATVAKSLSTLISRLRPVLAPAGCAIEHTGGGYRLVGPETFTDVAAFRADVTAARVAEAAGDHAQARERLRSALGRWRGALMADVNDLWFVASLAPVLEDERVAAEDALLRLTRAHESPAQTIALLRAQLARDPTREDRWSLLIDLLLDSGQRDDAVEAATFARAALREVLDTAPARPLREAEARAHAAVAPNSQPAEMLGRDAELSALADRVADGQSTRVVELVGEIGIGKSTMVSALAISLRRSNWTVLTLRCERGAAVPLGPVFAAFEDAGEARLLEELRAVSALPHDEQVDLMGPADLTRRRVLRTFVTAFERLARRGPLAIVVDDAQWLDEMSAAVLRSLLVTGDVAVTCVLTHRADADAVLNVPALVVDLRRNGVIVGDDPVDLGPLPEATIDDLVRPVLGSHAQLEQLVGRVHDAAGGNPLFALEYARHLAHADEERAHHTVPASMSALCEGRLATASSELRELLVIAATSGESFDLAMVARVANCSPAKAALLLSDAAQMALIRPLAWPGSYEFVHGVIREHLYDSIEPSARAYIHAAFGDALATDHERLAEAAWHYLRAQHAVPITRTASVVLEAARVASLFGAYATAATMLEEARVLAADAPGEGARLTVALAETRFNMGDSATGRALLAAGLRAAQDLDIPEALADAALTSSHLGIAATGPDAQRAANDVRHAAERLGDADPRRATLLWAWHAHLLVNVDPASADESLARAEASAALVDESWRVDHVVAFARLRQLEARGVDPLECAQRARDALATARRARDYFGMVQAGAALHTAQLRAGRYGEFRDDEPRIREYATRSGRPDMLWLLDGFRAGLALATAPMSDAEAAIIAAAELGMAEGIAAATVLQLSQLAVVRREQGRLHELEPLIQIAVVMSERAGIDLYAAQIALERDDVDGTRSALAASARPESLRQDWTLDAILAAGIDLAFEVGDHDYARAAAHRLMPSAGRVAVLASVNQLLGRVDRYLGRAASLAGDLDLAIERFATARKLDHAAGSRLWAGWAACDEARARLTRRRRGDVRAAMSLLETAGVFAVVMESTRLERDVANVASLI